MSVSVEPVAASEADPRRSFDLCRRVTRQQAGNFYYGLRLTPEPKRSALYAIYAWMRAADDIADDAEPGASKLDRLEAFRERSRAALDGDAGPDAESVWPALRATAQRFALDRRELEDLLIGLEEDVRDDESPSPTAGPVPRYATMDELSGYCYHVASVVGIVCLRIWGLRDPDAWPEARDLAVHRGRAFQLTNILRDVGSDFAEGRVYLPADHLRDHGLTPRELVAWERPGACRACLAALIERAREEYAASAPLDRMVHPDGAGAMWAMTEIYRTLLERVAADPRAVVRGRVSLPTIRKVLIGARAIRRTRERGR
jgi:phytoene synthase